MKTYSERQSLLSNIQLQSWKWWMWVVILLIRDNAVIQHEFGTTREIQIIDSDYLVSTIRAHFSVDNSVRIYKVLSYIFGRYFLIDKDNIYKMNTLFDLYNFSYSIYQIHVRLLIKKSVKETKLFNVNLLSILIYDS